MKGRALLAAAMGAIVLGSAEPVSAEALSLEAPLAPAGDPRLLVQGAFVRGHLSPRARVVVDYAHRPLVVRDADQALRVLVPRQLWLHSQAGIALAHRYAFGVDVPVVLGEPLASLGDVRLTARAVLFERVAEGTVRELALAAASSVVFPTGTNEFTSDGAVAGDSRLVGEGRHGDLRWAVNGGMRFRPRRVVEGIVPTHVGSGLALGAAFGVALGRSRDLVVGVEASLDAPFAGQARLFDPQAMSGQTLLTGHQRFGRTPFEVGLGGGPGFARGAGAADFRVIAFIGFTPESAPPPPDRDEDGVIDRLDACPRVSGEASRIAAMNGCPEMADRDGDAVPDAFDACPREAGVPTFVPTTHGCPKELVRDVDGNRDDADCPARGGRGDGRDCPSQVRVGAARIELDEPVRFALDTALLSAESGALLDAIARALRDHPEILRVEVQGHTDDTGGEAHNERLAFERASAVVRALVERGIGSERLRARGYGKRLPIDPRGTPEARARNRRVEIHVLERGAP